MVVAPVSGPKCQESHGMVLIPPAELGAHGVARTLQTPPGTKPELVLNGAVQAPAPSCEDCCLSLRGQQRHSHSMAQIWGSKGKLQESPCLLGDLPQPQGTLCSTSSLAKSLIQYNPNATCVLGTVEDKKGRVTWIWSQLSGAPGCGADGCANRL